MAREKEAYRDNLAAMAEFLHERYGDARRVMSIKDVCDYTGKCYRSVVKFYGVDRKGITIETFARMVS